MPAANPTLNYDILAVDLDGTLLGPDGRVSQQNADAVDEARKAGLEVVICTGRGFPESGDAITAIRADIPAAGRDVAPMVVSGGAMIVDAATGSTMHRWPIDRGLAREVAQLFAEKHRAPLLLKDRDAAGFDYLVVKSGPIEPPSEWWFSVMPIDVRYVDSIDDDEHPEHTVRVGFAARVPEMTIIANAVRERFGRRTVIHDFAAVSSNSDDNPDSPFGGKDDEIHLLEVFDAQVSKWTAIHRLAMEQGVPRERVAAIGDEINDLRLIEGAGLGIAMGNAIDDVKQAAKRHAPSHQEHGVAYAIEQILRGRW
jgi:hypothetical protein